MSKLEGLTIEDKGTGNTVLLGSGVRAITSKFIISGSNNRIFIGDNVVLNNVTIVMDSHSNSFTVEKNCRITCRVIQKLTDKNELIIGEGTSIGGANFINGEGSKIEIGRDCMLSYDIDIRSTDSHGIFELSSNKRINAAESISVGDNVWIGAHVVLCKGTKVSKGSVVGIGSVVTKEFEQENIVVCGNPARKVRENVYWEHKLLG